mmetsp:Transcript_45575/g.136216  ORF Transcript_45575/g.136216 Transcript_45575/m.136216 type:complete len:203 (+) Transcript_45575:399-1007(+)
MSLWGRKAEPERRCLRCSTVSRPTRMRAAHGLPPRRTRRRGSRRRARPRTGRPAFAPQRRATTPRQSGSSSRQSARWTTCARRRACPHSKSSTRAWRATLPRTSPCPVPQRLRTPSASLRCRWPVSTVARRSLRSCARPAPPSTTRAGSLAEFPLPWPRAGATSRSCGASSGTAPPSRYRTAVASRPCTSPPRLVLRMPCSI